MKTDKQPKTLPLPTFARELGLTREEAAEMRRQIQYCESSGPQRFVVAGRLEVKRP